jgi:hypothetical protein
MELLIDNKNKMKADLVSTNAEAGLKLLREKPITTLFIGDFHGEDLTGIDILNIMVEEGIRPNHIYITSTHIMDVKKMSDILSFELKYKKLPSKFWKRKD